MATKGLEMPRLGFGTYGRGGPQGVGAILHALEVGYRHLDTAQTYDTEREVGEAIRRAGLPREEVFVTTKIAEGNLGDGRLIPSLRESLDAMGLDHADLTLIHWPARRGGPGPAVYLPRLAEAKEQGLTRFIGVSNFTIALIEEAVAILGEGALLTIQVELNPWFQNRSLADHCTGRGIVVTCYQPVAQGRLGTDRALGRIAEAHGATPAQVALAWELAKGYAAIPTSGNPKRIEENFAGQKVALTTAEMSEIEASERGLRSINPAWGPDWD